MTSSEIIQELEVVRPHCLTDAPFSYCPGCGHGIVTRILAELIDEMGLEGNTIGVCPVGCSVTMYDFFATDMVEAAHGRAPAVATGLKRVLPDKFVFSYQGDGDLASIGMAETVHAATRGENITVIFINNAIYGMTGGQMAPTSLPGQITQTSPYGRDVNVAGFPIRVCELLSTLDGVAFAQRTSIDTPAHVKATKRAIKKGIQNQMNNVGYSIIEVVSTCPTNWGLDPVESMQWMRDNMIPYYPLGVFKDVGSDKADKDGGEAGKAETAGANSNSDKEAK